MASILYRGAILARLSGPRVGVISQILFHCNYVD